MGLDRYTAFVLRAAADGAITNVQSDLDSQMARITVELVMPLATFDECWKDAVAMESKDE